MYINNKAAKPDCSRQEGPNPLYTGGLFHCYMSTSLFIILGVAGLFRRFYSIFDGKSC